MIQKAQFNVALKQYIDTQSTIGEFLLSRNDACL